MSKESFYKLCNELRIYLEKTTTQFRDPTSFEKQVAFTLYHLADEGRSRKAANTFGIGKSTPLKIVRRVSKGISVHLAPKYLSLPTCKNEIVKLVEKFSEAHGFPQCIGAIDGTHIRIKKPISNPIDYINRKGIYSLNVQAAVDYKFLVFLTLSSNGQEAYLMRVYFRKGPLLNFCPSLKK